MSEFTSAFIAHLEGLARRDRGAIAVLRRSLAFAPGSYPPAFPVVERFANDGHEADAGRRALYLLAGLFANHPMPVPRQSLAAALAQSMVRRQSPSIEQRFVALLAAEGDEVGQHLRQAVSILAADGIGLDHAQLLDDLGAWLHPRAFEARDRIRQRWARDFYRALLPTRPANTVATATTTRETP